MADSSNISEFNRIVIEAENTDLQGDWKQVTVGGKESVLWDAAESSYKEVPKGQTLSYVFETDESGSYDIEMNSSRFRSVMNSDERSRPDTGNDAYVSVVDRNTGEVIQSPVKLFTNLGNSDRELKVGDTFDIEDEKSPAQVDLEANTQYRLEVSGRSDGYVLDQITLSNNGGGSTPPDDNSSNSEPEVPMDGSIDRERKTPRVEQNDNSGNSKPGAENKDFFIASTGAEPIENSDIPADTDDGNDDAKLDFSSRFSDPSGAGTRTLTGTDGANTFRAEALLNAKPEIIAEYTNDNGSIDWQGVAGENDNYHDHWVEGPGNIAIENFGEGDKFVMRGHTAEAILLEESEGVAIIGLVSDEGRDGSRGNGAHDFDVLGKATIYHDGSFNFGQDVTDITNNVFDGVS